LVECVSHHGVVDRLDALTVGNLYSESGRLKVRVR
jgi:hypothetical protein